MGPGCRVLSGCLRVASWRAWLTLAKTFGKMKARVVAKRWCRVLLTSMALRGRVLLEGMTLQTCSYTKDAH